MYRRVSGAAEPKTWDELLNTAQMIYDSGVTPFSVGGADGWTLTDWFENVYLSQAGPEKYDQLAKHEIKWTEYSSVHQQQQRRRRKRCTDEYSVHLISCFASWSYFSGPACER